MGWTKVAYAPSRQDQIQNVYDPTSYAITQTVLQTWTATTDAWQTTQPIDALTATDGTTTMPQAGGVYTIQGQAGFVCTSAQPIRNTTSPSLFEAQIQLVRKYAFQPPDATNWKISVSFKGQKSNQTAYQGYNTDTDATDDIINSAGQAFDPSIEETLYDEVVTVSYNTTSPPDLSSYRGMVNSASVSFTIGTISRSYDKWTLLCDDGDISTSLTLSDGSTPVWAVSIDFVNRTDTFVRNILDQGYYQLIDDKLVAIKDKYGDMVSAPVKLDGSGNVNDASDDPVYKHYLIEGETDLNPLFDGLS